MRITNRELNDGKVLVQDGKTNKTQFYLNSSLSLFQQYDVTFDLSNQRVGLDTKTKPNPTPPVPPSRTIPTNSW